MSRRITSDTVEKNINSYEAIQPADDQTQTEKDHQRITVTRETSTKEEQEDATVSSRVDHREQQLISYERMLISYEHLSQSTANKEVAGGDEATRPSESDQRLEKLRKSSNQTSRPYFDRFLKEFSKEFGKESAHHLAAFLKWLVLAIVLYLIVHC